MTVNGEIINFPTSDGIMLDGFLQRPKNPKPAVVIHVHGMGGSFYIIRSLQIGKNLANARIPFFSINTRGHDLSAWFNKKDGSHGPMIGTIRERFEDSLIDVDAAIKTMQHSYKNAQIFLSGHSTGCQKITYYALMEHAQGLILLAPGDDNLMLKTELGGKFNQTYRKAISLKSAGKQDEILPEVFPGITVNRFLSLTHPDSPEGLLFNYAKRLPYLKHLNTPVLAILGKKDPSTAPASKSLKLLKQQIKSEFKGVILDTDHSLATKETKISQLILKFIAEHS
jgi:predicted esterase